MLGIGCPRPCGSTSRICHRSELAVHGLHCPVMALWHGRPDLIEITMTLKPTTHSLWLALEDHFIGNHKTRAMILDAEFHNFCPR
jgi:hypothetical protein